ncbi:MAG TPA: AAA family ATPase [Pirellulales bacterium]|nr:AAA family ATPase [Pirellulales bacterium]
MSEDNPEFDLLGLANQPPAKSPGEIARLAQAAVSRQPADTTAVEWGDLAAAIPAEQTPFDLRALWHGLRRRWPVALALGIVGSAVASTAGWFLLEPDFTATGYLRIASVEPRLVNMTNTPSTAATEFEIYKRTQKELIMGRYVLNAALRTPDAGKIPVVRDHLDPVAWLAKQLRVDFPGNAEIMTISMSGESPETVATLVNAVVGAYQQEVVLVEKNQRMEKLNTLERVAREAEEKSRRARADLRRLADTLGTGDSQALTLKQQIALQRYATMLGEQTRVQIELMQAEIALASAKARQDAEGGPRVPESDEKRTLDTHPLVLEHRARLKDAERILANDAAIAAPDRKDELTERHRRKVEEAAHALAEAEREAGEEVHELLVEYTKRQNDAEIAEAESDVLLLKTQLGTLQKELATLSEEANKIGRSSIDVEMMRVEIERIDAVAQRLGSEIENIRVDLQSPARITLLSKAEVPAFKESKKQVTGTAGLAFVWFLLPVVGVAWLESRAHRVYAADARHLAGVRVLGALPLLAPQRRRLAGRLAQRTLQNRMAFRESIDGLRTVLLREAEFGPTHMVMVTSASGGEGKTSVATHLALSLARARRRCLLVDFDLRRPAAHRLLDLPGDRGVCEILRGEANAEDVVQNTETANLYFIAAGSFDDEALVALTQPQLPKLLAALRDRFDFIILDSSPILPVVDAVLVGKHADAVVLSVLCDVSRKPKIEHAYARLDMMGVRVLGAVVTGPQDPLMYDAASYPYLRASSPS